MIPINGRDGVEGWWPQGWTPSQHGAGSPGARTPSLPIDGKDGMKDKDP